jgi:hypothetical protein
MWMKLLLDAQLGRGTGVELRSQVGGVEALLGEAQ